MSTPALDIKIDHLRTIKAERIAGSLREANLSAADAARLTAAARRGVEQAAGVRIGSRHTWQIAVDMLAKSARVLCPYCGQGDPQGVPGPPKTYGHEGSCAR